MSVRVLQQTLLILMQTYILLGRLTLNQYRCQIYYMNLH